MAENEENNKENIMKMKNLKDMKTWSAEDKSKYDYPEKKNKSRDLKLYNFIREHHFDITNIEHMPKGPLTFSSIPSDKGNCFHVEIKQRVTHKYILFQVEQNERLEPGDEGFEEVYKNYKKEMGEHLHDRHDGRIEFHAWLPISPDPTKMNTDYFKEACLLFVKKELMAMYDTVLGKDLNNRWDEKYDLLRSDDGPRMLGIFAHLMDIKINNTNLEKSVVDVNHRLYKNSKALEFIKKHESEFKSNAMQVLEEFLKLPI